jgi:hypothetical protein
MSPHPPHRRVRVAVERGAPNPFEGPPRPFEHLLTSPVAVPDVFTVPTIAIALVRQPAVRPGNDDVQPVLPDLVLHLDGSIPVCLQRVHHTAFEVGLATVQQIAPTCLDGRRCGAVPDQLGAQIAGREVLRVDRGDHPHLVPGPGCGDVDPTHRRGPGHGVEPGAGGIGVESHHCRQHDDVPLIALEVRRFTAPNLPLRQTPAADTLDAHQPLSEPARKIDASDVKRSRSSRLCTRRHGAAHGPKMSDSCTLHRSAALPEPGQRQRSR